MITLFERQKAIRMLMAAYALGLDPATIVYKFLQQAAYDSATALGDVHEHTILYAARVFLQDDGMLLSTMQAQAEHKQASSYDKNLIAFWHAIEAAIQALRKGYNVLGSQV